MTYDELLSMAKRAASVAPESADNLLDVVQVVTANHGPATRPYAADRLMFLLAEYIEAPVQQSMRTVKH